MPTIGEVIAELAPRQHAVVARRQLLAMGIPKDTISSYIRRGELHVLHAGVYRAGHVAGQLWREMAAALACDGVVSHHSAVVLRQFATARPDEPVEITIEHDRRACRPGIRVYRSALPHGEVDRIDGVPVTTLPRTLLDFAGVATLIQLERVLALAERQDATLRKRLQRLLARGRNRRGSRALRTLLLRGVPALTRSEAEALLLELIRAAGLPEPQLNVALHGFEVDFHWPAARLVVEVDGYAWHGSRPAFNRDRQRDIALAAAGIQVIRIGWQQLKQERYRTVGLLAMAVGQGIARRASAGR
ncbi:hypothetical protein BH23GEM9_BH23GEM9_19900 [soil metagenome]